VTGINDTRGKFCHQFASVVDTGGKKFAGGVNDTGGNLPPGTNNTGGKFATSGKLWEQYQAAETLK
jgi:hypothetical protein